MVDENLEFTQYLEPPLIQCTPTFYGPTLFEVAEDTVRRKPYVIIGLSLNSLLQYILPKISPIFMQSRAGEVLNLILLIISILGSVYLVGTERIRKLITTRDGKPLK